MKTASHSINMMGVRTSMINRADLVYWLKRDKNDKDELEIAASLLGLEPKIAPVPIPTLGQQEATNSISLSQETVVEADVTSTSIPEIPFFYVANRERLASAEEVSERDNEPTSIQGVGDFTQQDLTPVSRKAEPLKPLIAWSRLWPVLKKRLHSSEESTLDIPCLIEQLASGRLSRRLPKLQRYSWSTQIEMLVDDHQSLITFQGDFDTVCEALQALVGQINLNLWKVTDGPAGDYQVWGHPEKEPQHWNPPKATTPVLILSDLGMLDSADSSRRRQWLRLGRQLKTLGIIPFVLAPLSAEHIDPELGRYYYITLWSNTSRLKRQRQCYQQPNQQAVNQLLVLLSPAIRIEPALLRAIRLCLPAHQFDAGCEAQFWLHPDVQVSPIACAIREEESIFNKYRSVFSDESVLLQRKVIELLRQHHANLFPAIWHEETLIWASLVNPALRMEYEEEIKAAELFLKKMAAMLYQRRENPDSLQQNFGVRHLNRSDSSLRASHCYYSVVEGIVNRENIKQGMPLRAGIDRDELSRTINLGVQKKHHYILYQQAEQMILAEKREGSPFINLQITSPYTRLVLMGESLFITQTDRVAPPIEQFVLLDQLPTTLARISSETESVCLRSSTEIITLQGLNIPDWAETIGRDQNGLFVEFKQQGTLWRLNWPEWGGKLGYDDYGLFADLTVKDITQRFRWKAPGTFQMGSPKSENDKYDDETQHQVTLSQGYWLADTACTQALWKAVMGNNPASFTDDLNKPVEHVNWDDSQQFIENLNALIPTLKIR